MLSRRILPTFSIAQDLITANLKKLTYSDSLEKTDTLGIVLADNEHKLLQSAIPIKGSEISVTLQKTETNEIFNVGSFTLDEISYRSPPSELTLKLNSLPLSSKRGIVKNRSWEEVTLQEVAQDISGECGLSLFYIASTNPDVKRLEQNEPDLSFLKRICSNYGLGVKVHNKQLIIFDEGELEKTPPVQVISYGDKRLLRFDGKTTATAIYSGADVSYKGNNVKEWLWGLFGANDFFKNTFGGGGGNDNLNINELVDSEGDAERLAKAKLRESNKDGDTLNLTLTGDFNLVAGVTIQLVEFGFLDGKYLIKKADHNLDSGGYTVQINCKKALNF